MTMTTEEARRIDIRYMKRMGFLSPGASGILRWSCGGEETGSMAFTAERGCLRLRYRYRDPVKGWVPYSQEITIDRTRCNFGGTRPWFRCPSCSRRIGVLYGAGVNYLCRHCYQLPYASQCERDLDRILRRAREIRKRLGASENLLEPIVEKPKGMHWDTFQRLVEEEQYWSLGYDQAVAVRYGM